MRSAAVAALSLLFATTLAAQGVQPAGATVQGTRSSTSKFFFTGALNGSAISFEESDETESGGGATLGIGYGFSPRWAAFFEGTAAQISSQDGDYTLAHVDFGARYHFANATKAWIPFLEAAFGARAAQENDVTICDPGCETGNLSMTGTAFTLGGGVMFYPTPKLAMTLNVRWSSGEFSDVHFRGVTVSGLDADAQTSRFGLGFVWFPQK